MPNTKPVIVMTAEEADAKARELLKAKFDSTRIGAPTKKGE